MKTLIIYGTKFDSTKAVAEQIAKRLENVTLLNSKNFRTIKSIQEFDQIVIGTNVMMGMFNGNIKRFSRKFNKILATKEVYGFVLGSNQAMAEQYTTKLKKITNAKHTVFLGGVIDPSKAKGLYKKMMENVLLSFKENNQPIPTIDQNSLEEFINIIKK
jgi:menaquinone-dependent protoporphyrinogen IX oxidase